jgi:hypothetical protein
MFSTLKNRLGIPGAISVIALVLAMAGGAYAAKGVIITKLSQIKPSVQKQLKGESGPAGANGPAGLQGPPGSEGKQGPEGKAGASVVNTSVPAGEVECEERGGAKFQVGTGPATFACNGQEGSPWTAGGTLPSKKTETGGWAFGTLTAASIPVAAGLRLSISFPIPLSAELGASEVHFINKTGKEVILNGEEFPEEVVPTQCGSALEPPGTAKAPAAAPGHLCVYAKEQKNATIVSQLIQKLGSFGVGASTSGALLEFLALSEGATGFGTWAVTAP